MQLFSQFVFESYWSEDKPYALELRGAQCMSALQCFLAAGCMRIFFQVRLVPAWFEVEELAQQVDNCPVR